MRANIVWKIFQKCLFDNAIDLHNLLCIREGLEVGLFSFVWNIFSNRV